MSNESQSQRAIDGMAAKSNSEVWVEKYRPETLADVVGQDEITGQLKKYVDDTSEHELPNLLFSGVAGIGKTTSALAIAKDLYGDDWAENFLELNASDERGIDVVRDRIKSFAKSHFKQYPFRVIFLDESDSLTDQAQSALRRTMEQHSHNIRFILSCNYSSEIIDPIQSRCTVCRFTPVDEESMKQYLDAIAEQEGLDVSEGGMHAIIHAANGDMRTAIGGLQATATIEGTATREEVYGILSTARPEDIESLITTAMDGNYYESRETLHKLLTEEGLSSGDILSEIHRQVWDLDISEDKAVDVMDRVGETEFRLDQGGSDQIQLEALLASFAKEG